MLTKLKVKMLTKLITGKQDAYSGVHSACREENGHGQTSRSVYNLLTTHCRLQTGVRTKC